MRMTASMVSAILFFGRKFSVMDYVCQWDHGMYIALIQDRNMDYMVSWSDCGGLNHAVFLEKAAVRRCSAK